MKKIPLILMMCIICTFVPQFGAYAQTDAEVKMLFDHSFYMCRERDDGYGGRISGWDINDAGGRVLNAAYLQMIDTSNIFPVEATRRFEKISSGCATLEFAFTVSDSMENGGFVLRNGSEETLSLKMHKGAFMSNGKILEYVTPNSWRNVKIELNFSNASAVVYINGTKKAELVMNGNTADNFYITSGDIAMGNMSTNYARMYTGYYVYEDFNNNTIPEDWSVMKNETEAEGSFSNVLNGAYSDLRVRKTFERTTKPTVIEFNAIQPKNRNFAFSVYDGRKNVFMISADGNDFYCRESENNVKIYNGYKENMWYSFRIIVYPEKKNADIYINGRLVKKEAGFYRTSASGIDSIDFYLEKNSTAPNVKIDNVRVYTYETFEDYVPEPKKVVSDKYSMGMQFCPLWTEGEGFGYDLLRDSTVREPILGFCDENSAETMDWSIKYMVEHGFDFQWHCIFMQGQVNEPYEPTLMSQILHEGYFKAKYADMMDFAILWENEAVGNWSENKAENRENFLKYTVPFWIEHYFKHPHYKTTDGRPIVGIYHLIKLRQTFGNAAEISDMFSKMGDLCEEEGLGRPYLVVNTYLVDFAESAFNSYKSYGFDASYAYNMGTNNAKTQMLYHEAGAAAANKVDSYRYIPTVAIGFDSYVVNGTTGYNMPPEEFDDYLKRFNNEIMPEIKTDSNGKKLIIAATWNELSEGHYFIPSKVKGFAYLDSFLNRLATDNSETILEEDCTKELKFSGWNIWNAGNASYNSDEQANYINGSWAMLNRNVTNYKNADKVRLTIKKENGEAGSIDFAITGTACNQCDSIPSNTYFRTKIQADGGGYTVIEVPITHGDNEENEARIWIEAGNYVKNIEVLKKVNDDEHSDIIPTESQKARINTLYPSDRKTQIKEKYIPENIPENSSVKYSYDFSNHTDGWKAESGCQVKSENGSLKVMPNSAEIKLVCDGISADISDVEYIKVTLDDNVSFDDVSLEYTTNREQSFNELKKIRKVVKNTDEIIFPVGMYPTRFNGKLGALRITVNGASSSFGIKNIELISILNDESRLITDDADFDTDDDFSGNMIPLSRIAYYTGNRIYAADGEVTVMHKNGDVLKFTQNGYSINGAAIDEICNFYEQCGEAYADIETASLMLGCKLVKNGNTVTITENKNGNCLYEEDFSKGKGYFEYICNVESAEIKDGAYEINYTAGDPFINTSDLSGEQISCNDIGAVYLCIDSEKDYIGQLFYTSESNGTYNEEMSERFSVSGGMHEYKIVPSSLGMNGILTGLRLDLGDRIGKNTVKIKYVRIYSKQQTRTYTDNSSPYNNCENISPNTKEIYMFFLKNPQSVGEVEISGGAKVTGVTIDGTQVKIGVDNLEAGKKYRVHLKNIKIDNTTAEEYFDFTTKISPNEIYATEFNDTYTGAFVSWGGGYDASETTSGMWNIIANGSNPYMMMLSGNIQADDVKYITIRVKANKAIKSKIYFSTASDNGFAETKTYLYDIPAGDFNVIKIPVNKNTRWNGIVNGLRYDFITSNQDTVISVDYVRMISDDFDKTNWICGNICENNGIYCIDSVYNNSECKRTLSIITANYSDGKLTDAKCVNKEVSPHSAESFSLKKDKNERVFIWDSYSPLN